ncbi:MAG: nuclear transport factor 2 family protein [Actinomycetota bacterium]|nr:nuclear transport factor 2 family protein [Actinomycetota bacterium]
MTIVRELYAAFPRGDIETIRSYLADDAVWHAAGRNRNVGDYQGRGAVVGLLTAPRSVTSDSTAPRAR